MNYMHIATLVLLVAKLAEAIHVSWWIVFLPSIISVGASLVVIVGLVIAGLIAASK